MKIHLKLVSKVEVSIDATIAWLVQLLLLASVEWINENIQTVVCEQPYTLATFLSYKPTAEGLELN